jgi:hypothetical protein
MQLALAGTEIHDAGSRVPGEQKLNGGFPGG